MPTYEITTDQGKFAVEADREPTPDEVLAALKGSSSPASPQAAEAKFGGRPTPLSRTEAAPASGELARTGDAKMTDLVLEAGFPMLAQAATTELGPLAQSGVGAATSALGNLLAQGRRMLMDEQQGFKPGELVQATITGSIPFAGPARNAERVIHPILNTALRATKEAAKFGAYGAAGEEIKSLLDNGRLATTQELIIPTAIPLAVGGTTSAIGDIGASLGNTGRRVAENAKDYSSLGVTPTPGMLLPEQFASAEAGKVTNNPGTKLAAQRDEVYGALQKGIQNVAPNPIEGAAIFDQAKPLLRQISTSERELSKLNETAQKAQGDAVAALGRLKGAQGEEQAALRKTATELSDKALNENLNSALENARLISVNGIAGGGPALNPAQARDLFVEHVAKPIEAAFEQHSAQLYSGVDNLAETFNAQPILDKAESMATELTGGLPKKLSSAIAIVKDTLGENPNVSLQALRNTRAELLRKVRLGEFGSDSEERLIKGISAEITSQIDSQATKALGEEGGNALKAANKFYRETRPLFDNAGVNALFAKSPGDAYVTQLLRGMKESGVNADEYKNLGALVKKIGEFNPELGTAAESHVNDLLRRSVLYDASRINPASATGELMVDAGDLTKTLSDLGKTPGTLEALKLGNPGKVAELQTLLQKYPEASKMTRDQWEQVLASPSFQTASRGVRLANDLGPLLGASQADNLIIRAANLDALGKTKEAQRAYDGAIRTLSEVNGDVGAARARYDQLRKDPVALTLNDPSIGAGNFNSFASSLFDAKANKVTNDDVRAIVDALGNSKNSTHRELLDRLRERYIADRIAAYHSTPISSEMIQQPEVKRLAEFFNPANSSDAANEIERARALLSPRQMSQLEDFAKAATSLNKYERMADIRVLPGSKNVPTVGQARRLIDVVTDLYRAGKYNLAARFIANPQSFSSAAQGAAEVTDFLQPVLNAGGMGAGRSVSNEPPASR